MTPVTRCVRFLGRHFRTTLVAGVLIMIPVVVTFLLLRFVFQSFDELLEGPLDRFVDYTTGMGLAALVIVIYLAGLFTTHVLGRRAIQMGHDILGLIPIVSTVYRTARQATEVFSAVNNPQERFSAVVLVEFPSHKLRSIGLVTGRLKDQDGTPLLAVYMPTSPFPTSGFLVVMPEDQVIPTDMAVDDAMKAIISAGIIIPKQINVVPNPFAPSQGQVPELPSDEGPGAYPLDNRASNQ